MKPPEILLVNDEPVQRYRLATLLRKDGYQVHEAEDGLVALERIESGLSPALIIADLYMPRLDGWQLCREIRERGLQIPILVISAFFEYEEITDLLKALGVNDFLRSPVRKEDLLRKVRDLLGGKSALEESESFSLLFVAHPGLSCESFLSYFEKTGFKVQVVSSLEEAKENLKSKKFHLGLVTSQFSPDEVLTLKQIAPQTSFMVLLLKDSLESPFRYVLKGARHVVWWPAEPEFVNYLCQRELRERALLLGQELLRSRTKELERVSAELQRIRQILHIVVEQAAEMGVVVTNEALNPVFINPTAQEFIQTSGGQNFKEFLVYLLGRDPQEEISCRLSEEGRYSCEVQVPNGQRIFVLTAKPLKEEERLAGLVFFLQDVTQEREWQKRLAHMQKMEALATLTAGIAHDFNNLLGAIRLKAELLLSRLAKDYRHYVSDIISICDRAALVVRQIMAVNRPSAKTEVANLNLQVKETISFLKETVPRGIRVQLFLPPEPLLVRLDPSQLSQIIMNLCLNAIQAMGEKGILTIRTGWEEYQDFRPSGYLIGEGEVLNGPYAWLQISDTGCGISPEILPRIFDPYFTTKDSQAGTGLGLAMTANIVKMAGGLIAVETALNQGTTFTIYLPREKILPLEEFLPQPQSLSPDFFQGKVLVVEDEEMICEAVSEFLEDKGYEVRTCSDGREAITLIKSGYCPDVAVIDLNLPGLSGLEVAKLLRDRYAEVPIIIATGRVGQDQHKLLEELQVKEVLIKPFSLEKFYASLCQVLSLRRKGLAHELV